MSKKREVQIREGLAFACVCLVVGICMCAQTCTRLVCSPFAPVDCVSVHVLAFAILTENREDSEFVRVRVRRQARTRGVPERKCVRKCILRAWPESHLCMRSAVSHKCACMRFYEHICFTPSNSCECAW
eukprot:6198245-Pleurochrysis_carterae.AAC.1